MTRSRLQGAGAYTVFSLWFAGLGLFPYGVSAQEFYRWVDDKGAVHFTDNLHSIPEKHRSQAQRKVYPAPRDSSASSPGVSFNRVQPGEIVIPFKREGNAIIVDGIVNGSGTVKFIVDTGAELTVIPASVAGQLRISDNRGLFIPIGGVGGIVPAPLVEIDSINVGGAEVRNLEILLHELPSRAGFGLLGMDFLLQFRLDIDHVQNRLTLTPESGPYEGRSLEAWQFNFRFWHNLKRRIEGSRSDPRFQAGAEKTLEAVDRKLNDLEIKASRAGLPREFRQ